MLGDRQVLLSTQAGEFFWSEKPVAIAQLQQPSATWQHSDRSFVKLERVWLGTGASVFKSPCTPSG
ncbi:hypothetical protein H6F61_04380 [Cyanobacteria bacterium FACHB-472]|nr:hypothetical protein [Cyanobacteria bacterium FACHB-472]